MKQTHTNTFYLPAKKTLRFFLLCLLVLAGFQQSAQSFPGANQGKNADIHGFSQGQYFLTRIHTPVDAPRFLVACETETAEEETEDEELTGCPFLDPALYFSVNHLHFQIQKNSLAQFQSALQRKTGVAFFILYHNWKSDITS